MRLYPLNGTETISHEDHGDFEVDDEGGFDLPEAFAIELHSRHIGGKPAWEDETERDARLQAEELKRRQDPASLYDLIASGTGRHAEPARQAEVVPVSDVQSMIDAAVANALAEQKATDAGKRAPGPRKAPAPKA